eukprot:TRINITY_DN34944_c0_g1_i1.p1 TRINITY_DN34944_c0_g1~~TRINITY_DN34944_c0_g1_i1.p1  ORF type:complete len:243 (-),score=68.05 TRINITY_DN34944_c0_g1_i1:44-772(-)
MEASKVLIHRGLCGISLRLQCLSIGMTYSILSTIAIFMSSMMLHNPLSFIDLRVAKTVHKHKEISANETNEDDESAMDELESVTNSLIREVGQNGIEMLIGGFATLIVSVLLIQGIRKNKTSWIFPWVVESIISTVGSFFMFLIRVASPASISVLKAFLVVFYFAISIYFILSVYSFYMIIKIQKKSVTHFLDHEFQGAAGEGSFYRPLEDSQEQIPPFREKKVPMHDHEDYGRENVLYAKM